MSEHMSDNNDTLRELIQIANDGAQFYADAADQVTNPRLVELFRRMGSHKRVLAAALASKLQAGGEQIPESGTLAGSLRRQQRLMTVKLQPAAVVATADGKQLVQQGLREQAEMTQAVSHTGCGVEHCMAALQPGQVLD